MSRFMDVQWENVNIKVHPEGKLRRWPIFRKMPFFTGDDLCLNLEINIEGEPPTQGIQIRLLGHDYVEDDYVRHLFEQERGEYPVLFERIPFSGEYIIECVFASPSAWVAHHYCTLGDIQVIRDDKPLIWALGLIIATLSSALTYFGSLISQHW